IGIWLSIGAPALFRRLGLAGEGAFGRRVDARMHGYMRHYMATALVVLLLVAGSTLYVRSAVPMGTRPAVLPEADVLVIGHRGAAGPAPENTLPSIAAALEYNAHVAEADLWPRRESIPGGHGGGRRKPGGRPPPRRGNTRGTWWRWTFGPAGKAFPWCCTTKRWTARPTARAASPT